MVRGGLCKDPVRQTERFCWSSPSPQEPNGQTKAVSSLPPCVPASAAPGWPAPSCAMPPWCSHRIYCRDPGPGRTVGTPAPGGTWPSGVQRDAPDFCLLSLFLVMKPLRFGLRRPVLPLSEHGIDVVQRGLVSVTSGPGTRHAGYL